MSNMNIRDGISQFSKIMSDPTVKKTLEKPLQDLGQLVQEGFQSFKLGSGPVQDLISSLDDKMLDDIIESVPRSDIKKDVPLPEDQRKGFTVVKILHDAAKLKTTTNPSERNAIIQRMGKTFGELGLDVHNHDDIEFLNDLLQHPSIQGLDPADKQTLAFSIHMNGVNHKAVFENLTLDQNDKPLMSPETVERLFEILSDAETLKEEIEKIRDLLEGDSYSESDFDETDEVQRADSKSVEQILKHFQDELNQVDPKIKDMFEILLEQIVDSKIRDQLADFFMDYILNYSEDDRAERSEYMKETLMGVDGGSSKIKGDSFSSESAVTPSVKVGIDQGKGTPSVGG